MYEIPDEEDNTSFQMNTEANLTPPIASEVTQSNGSQVFGLWHEDWEGPTWVVKAIQCRMDFMQDSRSKNWGWKERQS